MGDFCVCVDIFKVFYNEYRIVVIRRGYIIKGLV